VKLTYDVYYYNMYRIEFVSIIIIILNICILCVRTTYIPILVITGQWKCLRKNTKNVIDLYDVMLIFENVKTLKKMIKESPCVHIIYYYVVLYKYIYTHTHRFLFFFSIGLHGNNNINNIITLSQALELLCARSPRSISTAPVP